jgi:hypothetical protein
MGAGRSGSTILGIALGACTDVFYAGELDAWLRMSAIPNFGGDARTDFWRTVSERVDGQDLYGHRAWAELEYSLALLRIHRWRARRRLRKRYREILLSLYTAIGRTSTATHIVETSHYPLRAHEISALRDIDLYIILLVRKPRDVIASFKRQSVSNVSKSTLAANVYLTLTHILAIVVFLRHPRDRRIHLRYEDFVEAPEATLSQIMAWANIHGSAPADLSKLPTGIPFQGNRLLKSSTVNLHRRPSANRVRSLDATITTLLQSPWTLMLSRLRPRIRGRSRPAPPVS